MASRRWRDADALVRDSRVMRSSEFCGMVQFGANARSERGLLSSAINRAVSSRMYASYVLVSAGCGTAVNTHRPFQRHASFQLRPHNPPISVVYRARPHAPSHLRSHTPRHSRVQRVQSRTQSHSSATHPNRNALSTRASFVSPKPEMRRRFKSAREVKRPPRLRSSTTFCAIGAVRFA